MGAKEERLQPRRVQRRVIGLPGFHIRNFGGGGGGVFAVRHLKDSVSYESGTERTTPSIQLLLSAETLARFSNCHARVGFNQSSAAAGVTGGIPGD